MGTNMALSDIQIRGLKSGAQPTKHSDSGGLHLLVSPKGAKLWRLAYRYGGKQKTLALGIYPHVSLAEARQRRDAAKSLLATGVDPSARKRADKMALKASVASDFASIADEFLKKAIREKKAEATISKKRWLLGLANIAIGARPINEITAREVLVPLRKVEEAGNYETARRMRAVIGQVFRYAIATARADNDPTFGLKGALTTPTVVHRSALTNRRAFGGLVRAAWSYEGSPLTRAALQLMMLLFPRPGELRQAEWAEFDLQAACWTIPASRTKIRREHRKPLSRQAAMVLQELQRITGDRTLVFPSVQNPKRPMSENTLNYALRRMGFEKTEATAHGFRASASSLLNESGKWHADAIEAELGHVTVDAVRRAYHRAEYWDERTMMAQWWAEEIDKMRLANPA